MAATVDDAAGESQLAAAATEALAASLGRGTAHATVADAVRTAQEGGYSLAEVLARRPDLDLGSLSTAPDVGEASAQVQAVLSEHVRVVHGEK
jgi:3-carboxy-cis,cis-muconate cycloisomerase